MVANDNERCAPVVRALQLGGTVGEASTDAPAFQRAAETGVGTRRETRNGDDAQCCASWGS